MTETRERAVPITQRTDPCGEIEEAAAHLEGAPWPGQAILGVNVQRRWYPLRALAVKATGDRGISSDNARRQLEQLGFETTRFDRFATPKLAGTVVDRSHEENPSTSDTPPTEVLEHYLGEWVAMADGEIIDHDPSLEGLGNRLRARGLRNDRLFRVPNDLAEPVPATLG